MIVDADAMRYAVAGIGGIALFAAGLFTAGLLRRR